MQKIIDKHNIVPKPDTTKQVLSMLFTDDQDFHKKSEQTDTDLEKFIEQTQQQIDLQKKLN